MYKNMGIKGLDYKEITSLPKSKNVMNNLWRVITCNSIIARKKKTHAHHKTHLHTTKVYNTRQVSITIEVLLIKILLFFMTGQKYSLVPK